VSAPADLIEPESREVTDMPRANWSAKRERQYDHIKDSLIDRGETEEEAQEIAARTVNKERARAGEARTASRSSVEDISSGRRGGLRSHRGAGGRTYRQLYNEARQRGIGGRSTMNKAELERALER
jgi:plasmid stabilization system protein ParE